MFFFPPCVILGMSFWVWLYARPIGILIVGLTVGFLLYVSWGGLKVVDSYRMCVWFFFFSYFPSFVVFLGIFGDALVVSEKNI